MPVVINKKRIRVVIGNIMNDKCNDCPFIAGKRNTEFYITHSTAKCPHGIILRRLGDLLAPKTIIQKAREEKKMTQVADEVTQSLLLETLSTAQYIKFKEQGMSDSKIAKLIGTNPAYLQKWKKENNMMGVTKKTVATEVALPTQVSDSGNNEAESQRVAEELESLISENESIKRDNKLLSNEKDRLLEKLDKFSEENKSLRQEIQSFKNDLLESNNERYELTEELAHAKGERESLKQQLENLQKAWDDDEKHYQNEISVLREKIAHKNNQEVEYIEEPANAAEAVKKLLNGKEVLIEDENLWSQVNGIMDCLHIDLSIEVSRMVQIELQSAEED